MAVKSGGAIPASGETLVTLGPIAPLPVDEVAPIGNRTSARKRRCGQLAAPMARRRRILRSARCGRPHAKLVWTSVACALRRHAEL